jgi:diketogulonate reductase-like aldo/keto reductase
MREQVVMDIGEKHGKSPAQVLLRWGVQSGTVVIPKTQKVIQASGPSQAFIAAVKCSAK